MMLILRNKDNLLDNLEAFHALNMIVSMKNNVRLHTKISYQRCQNCLRTIPTINFHLTFQKSFTLTQFSSHVRAN